MILPFDFRNDPYLILDFTAHNPELDGIDLTDTAVFTDYVFGKLRQHGAVVGVGVISLLIEVLRQSEHGFALGSLTVSAPHGTQEIGLGVAMLIMLIFRRNGIVGNQEIGGRLSRFLAPQLKRSSKFTEDY